MLSRRKGVSSCPAWHFGVSSSYMARNLFTISVCKLNVHMPSLTHLRNTYVATRKAVELKAVTVSEVAPIVTKTRRMMFVYDDRGQLPTVNTASSCCVYQHVRTGDEGDESSDHHVQMRSLDLARVANIPLPSPQKCPSLPINLTVCAFEPSAKETKPNRFTCTSRLKR